MTDEACFDWTLLTNRRLEGLGVRERAVVRANDRLALKGARDKSIEALDYAQKSGLVPICGRAPDKIVRILDSAVGFEISRAAAGRGSGQSNPRRAAKRGRRGV
jgi:hypothetical protein